MIGLKRRMELVERLHGPAGRLIIVRADTEAELMNALAASAIDRVPGDTVIKLCRSGSDRPRVISVHEEGPEAFLASLDGKSLPLVKEAAGWSA